jgi:hypothetical protein
LNATHKEKDMRVLKLMVKKRGKENFISIVSYVFKAIGKKI